MCTSKYEHAERLLTFFHEAGLKYHNHKETMAYAATAAFVAAFSAGLVSKDWPPTWGFQDLLWRRVATVIGITIFAGFGYFFVRWQLENRRWASIRVEAIEFLLFSWLANPPKDSDLQPYQEPPRCGSDKSLCNTQKVFRALKNFGLFVLDLFWPIKKVYSKGYGRGSISFTAFPEVLVKKSFDLDNKQIGGPLFHERLITGAMWLFYIAVIVRTIFN